MGRPKGSKNVGPFPFHRSKNFYWRLINPDFYPELEAFKRMHNRVRDGKVSSIVWARNFEGFRKFLVEVGPIPKGMIKPSIGRIKHKFGYREGNVQWEEHAENSIKRKGTRYEC